MPRYSPADPARRYRGILGAFAALCLTLGDAYALDPIELSSPYFKPLSLYGHFDILIDEEGGLGVGDLNAPEIAARFFPSTARNANLGFTKAEIWARFSVRYGDTFDEPVVLVIDEPLIDNVDLYTAHASGSVTRAHSGDGYPFGERDYEYRNITFKLEPEPGTTVNYYLRIHSPTSAVGLPLSLYNESDFLSKATKENVLLGGYFGLMIGLSLSAVVLFALGRQITFFYYFLYLGFFALMMCAYSGYGMQFLWPDSPAVQQLSPKLLMVLTIITGVLFGRRFIDIRAHLASANKLFGAVLGVLGFGFVSYLTMSVQLGILAMMASGVAVCLIIMAGAFRAMVAGDRVAPYFLVGFAAFTAGVLVMTLDMTGMIAPSPLTTYSLYLGSLVQFLSLSLALGERLWILQREKDIEIETVSVDLATLNDHLDEIVETRTQDLEERNRELSDLAIRDSLTGLYNHSTSIELLEQFLNQSQRYKFPIATIMVDIDHFKPINDTYGHQIGDKVLERVSRALSDSVRGADVVGRYGGEEFIIVMPHADAPAAREYGDRLLQKIREIEIPGKSGAHITASVGVSVFYPHGHRTSAPEVIRRADEALYRSKRDGRDRLTVESLTLVGSANDDQPVDKPSTRA
ncbi:MAG: sensor domain-containing diguanylate cyclase [Proteobacteria bacterium]|nr:sensor domain-containing diguanylate cyclase [Pseudomonadota bacterium]